MPAVDGAVQLMVTYSCRCSVAVTPVTVPGTEPSSASTGVLKRNAAQEGAHRQLAGDGHFILADHVICVLLVDTTCTDRHQLPWLVLRTTDLGYESGFGDIKLFLLTHYNFMN